MFLIVARLGERLVCVFYRITAFGQPRGPWRTSKQSVRRDAIEAGLGAYDEDRRFFLDAIANIQTVHENELIRSGVEYPGSCMKKRDPKPLLVRRLT